MVIVISWNYSYSADYCFFGGSLRLELNKSEIIAMEREIKGIGKESNNK